jgi:hypothetical protein
MPRRYPQCGFRFIRYLGYPVFVPDRREVVVGVNAMIRNVPCVRIDLVASNCIDVKSQCVVATVFGGSELLSLRSVQRFHRMHDPPFILE